MGFFEESKKEFKIKKIEKKLKVPKMKKNMIDFLNWFSIYNVVPLGMCSRLTLLSKNIVENISDNSFDQYFATKKSISYILNTEQKKCLSEIKREGKVEIITISI